MKGTLWLVIVSISRPPSFSSGGKLLYKKTQNTKVISMFVGTIISYRTQVNLHKYLSPQNQVELCSMIEEMNIKSSEMKLK